jgi:glutamate dehydrogenase (NADP+)
VATYANEKATQLGAKVVAMSDSNGYVYDPDGIDLDCIKEIKQVKRGRIKEYVDTHPKAEYHEGCAGIWNIKCDIALPCATQNELLEEDAKMLIANGCRAVCEGANMPTTLEATRLIQGAGILFVPGKAANAGGVATSGLEMSQNAMRIGWTRESVDNRLHDIMINIHDAARAAAQEFNDPDNYVMGANIAGFRKVADAMIDQGVV